MVSAWAASKLRSGFLPYCPRESFVPGPCIPSEMSTRSWNRDRTDLKSNLAQSNELFRFNLLYWDWLWVSGRVTLAIAHFFRSPATHTPTHTALLKIDDPGEEMGREVGGQSWEKFQIPVLVWWHQFIHKSKLHEDKWKCLWFRKSM